MARYGDRGGAFTIDVKGEEKLVKVLERLEDFQEEPGAKAVMRRGVARVVRGAKQRSPVDTGRLKSSIDGYLEVSEDDFELVVGSNVHYAPYMERGTGVFAGNAPHHPPAAALEGWAKRHGFSSGYVVAMIIGRRGGLEPREFLKKGLEDAADDIVAMISDYIENVAEG